MWAVTVAVTATAISYDALHPLPAKLADQSGSGLDMVVGLVFIVVFATVGAVLSWQRPANPIGWLLSASGLAYALTSRCGPADAAERPGQAAGQRPVKVAFPGPFSRKLRMPARWSSVPNRAANCTRSISRPVARSTPRP